MPAGVESADATALIVKTGAGEVLPGDASYYGGMLKLNAGTAKPAGDSTWGDGSAVVQVAAGSMLSLADGAAVDGDVELGGRFPAAGVSSVSGVTTVQGTVAGVPNGAQSTVRLKDCAVTDAAGLPFGSFVPAYTAPIELAGVVGSPYAAPAPVDYNGDGLLDVLLGEVAENGKDEMVVGQADGTIRIFTAAEGGYWADAGALTCSVGGESGIVDAESREIIITVPSGGESHSTTRVNGWVGFDAPADYLLVSWRGF